MDSKRKAGLGVVALILILAGCALPQRTPVAIPADAPDFLYAGGVTNGQRSADYFLDLQSQLFTSGSATKLAAFTDVEKCGDICQRFVEDALNLHQAGWTVSGGEVTFDVIDSFVEEDPEMLIMNGCLRIDPRSYVRGSQVAGHDEQSVVARLAVRFDGTTWRLVQLSKLHHELYPWKSVCNSSR